MYRVGQQSRRSQRSQQWGRRLWWLVAVLLGIMLASGAAYYIFVFSKPAPEPLVFVSDNVVESPAKTPLAESYRGLPVRLKIPAIGVDTEIEYLGNTSAGAMSAPQSPIKAGWYKYGAIPGEFGSAVIAGHVVGPRGEPAAFKRLSELADGNTIEVVDAKGQSASFTVRIVRTYDESQQHAEVFNSDNGTHLNLITCAGEWDAGSREYMQRLVVFADKTP